MLLSVTISTIALLVSSVHCAPLLPQGETLEPKPEYQVIPILKSAINGPEPDGSYNYFYETGNGINVEESGSLRQEGEDLINTVKGSYSYTLDDGTPISVSYTADENGFVAKGAHLPTAPPIPPAILRALEWIAAHPEEDNLRR